MNKLPTTKVIKWHFLRASKGGIFQQNVFEFYAKVSKIQYNETISWTDPLPKRF